MRRLLIVLALASSLSGCTIGLAQPDRERVDKFLAEIERFNDNIEAVIHPEGKKPRKATTSRPLASNE